MFTVSNLCWDKRKYAMRLLCGSTSPRDTSPLRKSEISFYKMEANLRSRELKNGRSSKGEAKLLVKWLGFEDDQKTWETLDHLLGQVPELVLGFTEQKMKRD